MDRVFNVSQQTKDMLSFFDVNYDVLVTYHLNDEDKIYLGDRDNRVCRFCGKNQAETSFKNVSHAIPELIGNKKLIANYECDACNSKFSRLLESHMGNYMNLWHTMSQVKGKKKVPSFKTVGDKSRVDIEESVLIKDYEDDPFIKIDVAKKLIAITAKRRSYIPIAIYKTLVKMAMTIMPENELINFSNTMEWINEEDHGNSRYKFKELKILFSIAPGIKPFPFVSCMLVKRKMNHPQAVPYMIFILTYGNFSFQIFLPLCKEDRKLKDEPMTMMYYPTPLDIHNVKLDREQLDMSGCDKIKEEEVTVTMEYSEMIERDVENENGNNI